MRAARVVGTIAFGLFSLSTSKQALAADWYVDAAAADGGNGAKATPYKTINAALPGLQRGDTVWLASGTYDEVVNVPMLSGSGTTTFRALPGATPVIDGTSGSSAAGFIIQTATPSTTFQDLTIQNAPNGALGIQFYYADGGSVLHCTSTNITGNAVNLYYSSQGTVTDSKLQGNIGGRKTTGTVVERNEVYGSNAEGIGLYDGSTGCTVSHNVIHDNYSVNLYLDSISHSVFDGNLIYETDPNNDLEAIEISDEGHYVDLPAPVNSYNTIINNVIYNHNEGIVFWYSDEWSTQALNDQSGLRYDVIANNTLVNNKGAFKWDSSPAHVGTTIQNNVIVDAAGSAPNYVLQANSANGITLDHNLWFAPDLAQAFLWVGDQTDHPGFVSASGQGGGDVLLDALLVGPLTAPPATNLALTMGSPAIGAGISLSAVTDDFLGATRPASGVDLGAFQFGASAPADGGVGPSGVDSGTTKPDHDSGVAGSSDGGVGGGAHPDGGAHAGGGGDSGGATGSMAPGSRGASSSGCSLARPGSSDGHTSSPPAALFVVGLVALLRAKRRRAHGA
jgi:hypothetical protein